MILKFFYIFRFYKGTYVIKEDANIMQYLKSTRQMSSMIPLAKSTVTSVAINIFNWNLFCCGRFWKVETYGRTDGRVRHMWSLQAVSRPSGSIFQSILRAESFNVDILTCWDGTEIPIFQFSMQFKSSCDCCSQTQRSWMFYWILKHWKNSSIVWFCINHHKYFYLLCKTPSSNRKGSY